jgi:hypothetical protein
MQEYTAIELFRLSRAQLIGLDHETAMAIQSLPELSEARTVALINQRRIRRELGRREIERGLGL